MDNTTHKKKNTKLTRKKLSRFPIIRPSSVEGSIYTWDCGDKQIHRDSQGDSVWITRDGEVISTVSTDQAFLLGEKTAGNSPVGSTERTFGQILSSAATIGVSPGD